MKKINAAVWTTKYKNDLPDSAFMYIEPGGKKDDEGKTTPRSLRHFPYKDMSGKVDVIHLRNAIARIPQAKIPTALKKRLQEKARRMLAKIRKSASEALSSVMMETWKEKYKRDLADCKNHCKEKRGTGPMPTEEYQLCISECMSLKGY